MKKNVVFLIFNISIIFYSNDVLNDILNNLLEKRSYINYFNSTYLASKKNFSNYEIISDRIIINYPNCLTFIGNVNLNINKNDKKFTANKIELIYDMGKSNYSNFRIIATGNVSYYSKNINLNGIKAYYDFNKKTLDIHRSNYEILGDKIKIIGKANLIKQNDNFYTYFKDANFTACPFSKYSWNIIGSSMFYNHKTQIMKIWNSKFTIGKVPIFYSPYMQFPIGNKRCSGFLISNFNYCRNNGIKIEIPYYFNIAPNFDLTVKSKYKNNIGYQIQTEFRYLFRIGEGIIQSELKPKFINLNRKNNCNEKNYWLIHWKHNSFFKKKLNFNIDYSKMSDLKYLNITDLNQFQNSSIFNDDILQKFSIKYFNNYFNFNIFYIRFQNSNLNKNNHTYYNVPELDFNFHKMCKWPFSFNLLSQVIRFRSSQDNCLNSFRIHSEPSIGLTLVSPLSDINTEIKIMLTHFEQNNIDNSFIHRINNFKIKRNVYRVIPQFKIDSKILLEKNIDYKGNYKQLLESKLQYLYVPYRKQNFIGLYDFSISEVNFLNLFDYRVYNGFDRIAPAKQLTHSIVTKIYNKDKVEIFNNSIGQIYHAYLPTRNCKDFNLYDKYKAIKLILVGETHLFVNNNLKINNKFQYNSYFKNITLENLVIEYNKNLKNIFQFNYRYVNHKYIKYLINKNSKNISQIGISSGYQFNERLILFNSLYYDLSNNSPIGKLIELQYSNYCWTVNLGYEKQKLLNYKIENKNHIYDSKLLLNISINGIHIKKYNLVNKLKSFLIPYQGLF